MEANEDKSFLTVLGDPEAKQKFLRFTVLEQQHVKMRILAFTDNFPFSRKVNIEGDFVPTVQQVREEERAQREKEELESEPLATIFRNYQSLDLSNVNVPSKLKHLLAKYEPSFPRLSLEELVYHFKALNES